MANDMSDSDDPCDDITDPEYFSKWLKRSPNEP